MAEIKIPKAYEAKAVEDSIYKHWEESGFFNPDKLSGSRKESFTISMPPPNATGMLHIGHAVMLAIQDLVIRFARMQGKKALWLPGTDHAAIATQNKVEKLLKEKEGKTRHDLGREEFLKRVNAYVKESQDTIKNQIRKMGSSCDWSRERFTLDEGLTKAVQQAFVEMYNDGLIYRGNRIVNWCPHCASTLSDDEVEYREEKAPFYYFKYGPVIIGTARPETKFGDKVIIVHPDDKRYKDLVGKEMEVDWILGQIKAKVIADKVADPELGSGAMTITPGHSFVDFELAQKYNLPIEKIIDEQGKLTKAAGEFQGLDVKTARQKVVDILDKKGLIDHVDEDYVHNLSVCYRCENPVEPLVSKQWFIDVKKPIKKFGGKSLKERAIEVVRTGDIQIIPERFNKVYFHWMENLRDWCISRQIWFGHQMPVWYNKNLKSQNSLPEADPPLAENLKSDSTEKDVYVGIEPPKGDGWTQETDTLDTWFSSGLWTFSTLGWPKKTTDLKTFHPTSLMETGYDILFFWVARMIIMSTYLMEEIPFKQVYLHGLVRDEKGRKMSKSLDNIIDPLDTIKKYGADATRLSLIIGTTPGNDTNISEAKIEGYKNFINKLWNISRYILMNVDKEVQGSALYVQKAPAPKTLADKWILAELNDLIHYATENLEKYNFSIVGEKIYEFTWAKLADWYVEISKLSTKGSPRSEAGALASGEKSHHFDFAQGDPERSRTGQNSNLDEKTTDAILLYVLQNLLKLWHPFTPFVTEEIWQKLNRKDLLMIQAWPKAKDKVDKNVIKDFSLIQDIIVGIRNLRAEAKIPPAKKLKVIVASSKNAKLIKSETEVIKSLARLDELEILTKAKKIPGSLSKLVADVEIYLPVSGMIDISKEIKRLETEVNRLEEFNVHLAAKLKNQRFLDRAPEKIVESEKFKLVENKEKLEQIKQQLKTLK